MIKMPREVTESINLLGHKGYKVYAVGGCVRDSLLGEKPIDWDLCTDAPLSIMQETFPKGKVMNEALEVIRLDFTKNEDDLKSPVIDIARFREEYAYDLKGSPIDFKFVENIEADLKRRDFTINALADNASLGFVDIFDGKKDLKEKRIKIIGDSDKRFSEDPLRMLRAARFAAEKGFVIEEETYMAIKRNCNLLSQVSIDKVREDFMRLAKARFASKGFEILFDTGLIYTIAEVTTEDFKFKKKVLLSKFLRNIDSTYPYIERRLALFYSLLNKSDAVASIEKLNYRKELKKKLMFTINNISYLGTIKSDVALKDYISEIGFEYYEALDHLAQDKIVVYGGSPARVNKREKIINRIKDRNEPVLQRDLVINGDDLKEANIEEKLIGNVLFCLLLDVHRKPFLNNRGSLLTLAKSYEKSSLKRFLKTNSLMRKLR